MITIFKNPTERAIKISIALTGRKLSEEHKKNLKVPHIGSGIYQRPKEEKAHHWKGDKVGYRGIHLWVVRHLGKAIKCEHCGKEKTTPRSIHWANKSHNYLRELTDWISLCVKCHKKYDKGFN